MSDPGARPAAGGRPAVEIDDVSRSYGEVTALRGLTLELDEGLSLALVGPDGAGKTTLFRLLTGLLPASSGTVRVLGLDPRREGARLRPLLGYLSQGFSLYGDLTVDENIAFFAEIHGIRGYRARRDELLERMNLIEFRRRLAERLSGGMKQKLALACALVHSPRLLLLDEPTTGVDPVSRREFWLLLSELRADGMAMVLATPYLDEAERCDRVALLHNGELLASGRPLELTSALASRFVEAVCREPRRARRELLAAGWRDVQLFGDRVHVAVSDAGRELPGIRERLEAAGVGVSSARVVATRLENVFVSRLTGASAPGAGASGQGGA
jgi:ABC-2 type transport system ATP-binding protein